MAEAKARGLIFENVRKAQSQLNRIAGQALLSDQDKALFAALTQWQQSELGAQAAALEEN